MMFGFGKRLFGEGPDGLMMTGPGRSILLYDEVLRGCSARRPFGVLTVVRDCDGELITRVSDRVWICFAFGCDSYREGMDLVGVG